MIIKTKTKPPITVTALKTFAKKHGADQAVLLTWERSTNMSLVTTWGSTQDDCGIAAMSGNNLKQALGWPRELCRAIPPRMSFVHAKQILREASLTATPMSGGVVNVDADSGAAITLDEHTIRALMFISHHSNEKKNATP